MADVEVAVGLGRESGLDDGVAELSGADVFGDLVAEEVGRGAEFFVEKWLDRDSRI
jgi:hypothetical protein